jgi:WD40 repeat protein
MFGSPKPLSPAPPAMHSSLIRSSSWSVKKLTAAFTALALLTPAGCGLVQENAQEEVSIPPAQAQLSTDSGLGPGTRPLSFGPGDKGSPRVNPSGNRVAFVLDGYVAEKPLYTQDFHRITAKDFGAESTEWLLDGNLVVLSPEDETKDRGVKTTPVPSSLFAAQSDNTSSDGSPSISKLTGKVEAAAVVPDGQSIIAAVATPPESESPTESPSSRLMILQSSEESTQTYLGEKIEGYVTDLSVSPDGGQAILAVQPNTNNVKGRKIARSEVQVYRLPEGLSRRVARAPKGTEVLGAPQWTPQGIYFVAGAGDESSKAAHDGDLTSYALYRIPEGSGTPEPVRSVGEDFVAASISVSPDGNRLAVVGRRNLGSSTNLYVLDLASDTLEAVTNNENMEIKTTPRELAWSPDGRSIILVARGALSGPSVYDAPAKTLSSAFYNLYEVPVAQSSGGSSKEG